MKIALIAPPFIPVPPIKYGGTELFIAELARGLQQEGIDVTLYANGESTLDVPTRWLYPAAEWPVLGDAEISLKSLTHSAWAVQEAVQNSDIVHFNSAPGLSFSRFTSVPFVYTIHHPYEQSYTDYYDQFAEVSYVTISNFQQQKLHMPRMRTIHHGLDTSLYSARKHKEPYLSFLGRIAPSKGTHLAIEIARKAGLPLKIGGEVQPVYQSYWETMVKPHVDGKWIEYVGEVGMEDKCELLGNSLAMVFPVQWDEPFGLVMIEAMACGTPVLALPGGSVKEVVKEGVSGHVRSSVEELAGCARNLSISPETVRAYMEKSFSVKRMTQDYIHLYSGILRDSVPEVEQSVA